MPVATTLVSNAPSPVYWVTLLAIIALCITSFFRWREAIRQNTPGDVKYIVAMRWPRLTLGVGVAALVFGSIHTCFGTWFHLKGACQIGPTIRSEEVFWVMWWDLRPICAGGFVFGLALIFFHIFEWLTHRATTGRFGSSQATKEEA